MEKQKQTTRRERQLRFAEAGILFVLLLGVTIFLGVRFQGDATEEVATRDAAAATATAAVASEPEPVVDTATVAAAIDSAAAAGPVVEPEPEPEPAPVTYAEAEAVYHDGAYAEAADLFARYVDGNPDNVWGLYMLGLSAWKAGDLDSADLALAEARDLRPDHLKSHVNHARVLLDLGRDDEAAMAVDAALAVDAADASARRLQARLAHRAGRLEEAADLYTGILVEDRDDVWALNNLGLIRVEQERFAEALAPLARAAGLADAACIRNNLGVALERTGHHAAAAEAYADALAIDADYARAERSLARVEGLTGSPDAGPVDLAALAAGFLSGEAGPAEGEEVAVAAVVLPEPGPADARAAEPTDAPDPAGTDDGAGDR